MYRTQHLLAEKEALYIAGPECFYTYGYDMLAAMRKKAEALGFNVTLPNDHPLDMENPDLQKRADSIFEDLKRDMNETTIIVSDLEAFRGAEPDSGTIYEIGMAYAKGALSYGYTRDKRSIAVKNQNSRLKNADIVDENGKKLPYADLPFSPNIIGSTKIVEGDFDDCLKVILTDLEERYKKQALSGISNEGEKQSVSKVTVRKDIPTVYLSGPERYDEKAEQLYTKMKETCQTYGLYAVTPIDTALEKTKINTENPYMRAASEFNQCQQHVRDCDAIIADLNDFRGYEICNDVGFECGMAFQLGKKLYGYMENTDKLIHKIPHLGEEKEFRDQAGSNVENFDYPANLMFGSSMDIFQGKFEDIIQYVAKELKAKKA